MAGTRTSRAPDAEQEFEMGCPHLKEVVMLFCDAYPVKKMLPLDRIASAHPCLGRDFERCPLYRELVERLARECDGCPTSAAAAGEASTREVCHVARPATHPVDGDVARPVRH
jgi:hypothetical protein